MCLADAFDRAVTALGVLSVDPRGLGGLALRARSGPVRDAVTGMLDALGMPLVRLHPGMGDDVLYGGLDLSATLAAGRMVTGRGLLAAPGALVLAMAERAGPGIAARLGMVLDAGLGHCLIALDEGAEADERLPASLAERLAFGVDLSDVAVGDVTGFVWDAEEIAAARVALAGVVVPEGAMAEIVGAMAAFGVESGRAGLFTLSAARAHAALCGRAMVGAEDLEAAAGLVLAHRATRVPEAAEPEAERPEPAPEPGEQAEAESDDLVLPEELLIEAVRAMLPDDLLDRLRAGKARTGKGDGSGAARKGNRRGRPLPSRAGRMGDGARVDIVATLRVAAPWQTLRTGPGVKVRAGDLRFRRFEEKSDRLLVFTVDASGSAALARLGEAKGAVELLLAQAYARRDHVALVAFRGTGAEVLLPPTRSLVQTKRRLAAPPGGGGGGGGGGGPAAGGGVAGGFGAGGSGAQAGADTDGGGADRRAGEYRAGWPGGPCAGRRRGAGDGAGAARGGGGGGGDRHRQPAGTGAEAARADDGRGLAADAARGCAAAVQGGRGGAGLTCAGPRMRAAGRWRTIRGSCCTARTAGMCRRRGPGRWSC
jgi:magnesium chelatase subunit D